MKNSNIIQIASDYKKMQEKRELARLLNQVTELCAQKNIKWEADLSTEIKIGRHRFPCDKKGLKRARNFVLNLEQKELEMVQWKKMFVSSATLSIVIIVAET